MTPCAAMLGLLLLQERPPLAAAADRRSWLYRPLLPGPSKEWQAARKRAEALIRKMKMLPPSRRAREVQLTMAAVRDHLVISEEFYRATLVADHFYDEWRKLSNPPNLPMSMAFQAGQADPEYARASYMFYTRRSESSEYWQLGIQLIKIFPKDRDLAEAFVTSAFGDPRALAQVDQALSLLPQPGFTEQRNLGFRARLIGHRTRYVFTKSAVRRAIAENEAFLRRELPQGVRETFQRHLAVYRKRLTDPKYKEG